MLGWRGGLQDLFFRTAIDHDRAALRVSRLAKRPDRAWPLLPCCCVVSAIGDPGDPPWQAPCSRCGRQNFQGTQYPNALEQDLRNDMLNLPPKEQKLNQSRGSGAHPSHKNCGAQPRPSFMLSQLNYLSHWVTRRYCRPLPHGGLPRGAKSPRGFRSFGPIPEGRGLWVDACAGGDGYPTAKPRPTPPAKQARDRQPATAFLPRPPRTPRKNCLLVFLFFIMKHPEVMSQWA